MERFTPQQRNSAAANSRPQETFTEMANVTAARSGLVGKLLVVSLIVVSIAVTAFVGLAIVRGSENGPLSKSALVKEGQFQAVFLTDGQIYFGKIDSMNEENVVLKDIYYLQVEQQVQPDRSANNSSTQQPRISLAKLGNELHGPEDKMYINPDQVLFWENLKNDGKVVTAIKEYKKKQ